MSGSTTPGAPEGDPEPVRAAGGRAPRFHAGLVGVFLLALISAGMLLARAALVEAPAAGPVRFVPVDVYVDSGTRPLAAYQFDLTAKNAQIAGLEGGDSVFKDAPYYDPAALHPNPPAADDRIIVAAFSTAADLPKGNTRVARLHLMLRGIAPDAAPAEIGEALDKMPRKLMVATDASGATIEARLTLRPSESKGETQ